MVYVIVYSNDRVDLMSLRARSMVAFSAIIFDFFFILVCAFKLTGALEKQHPVDSWNTSCVKNNLPNRRGK